MLRLLKVAPFSSVLVLGILLLAKPAAAFQVAYARVLPNGTLDSAHSKNVVGFVGGTTGLFCFQLSFTPDNAVASPASDPTASTGLSVVEVSVPPAPAPFSCPSLPGANAFASVFSVSGAASRTAPFYIEWTTGTPVASAPTMPSMLIGALGASLMTAGVLAFRKRGGSRNLASG